MQEEALGLDISLHSEAIGWHVSGVIPDDASEDQKLQ